MLELRPGTRKNVLPLNSAIRNRRATQGFSSEPIADDDLTELLELALLAPSGYNLQPWRFIVVRDLAARQKLRKAAMNQPKVEEAPVVIIACADPVGWKNDIERVIKLGQEVGQIKDDKAADFIRTNASKYLSSVDTKVWATKQTMIAYTHLMMLAECYGFDTAPMEGFFEDQVKEAFEIPDELLVIALLAIGHASKPDRPFGGRFDMGDLVSLDKFSNPFHTSFT